MRFFKCSICGKIIALVEDSGVATFCCGKEMEEIIPNKEESVFEKHIPFVTVKEEEVIVKVGEVVHPMSENHYIKWILLRTNKGNQRKILSPSSLPEASFLIEKDEKVEEVLEYCSLHGLYSKKL